MFDGMSIGLFHSRVKMTPHLSMLGPIVPANLCFCLLGG